MDATPFQELMLASAGLLIALAAFVIAATRFNATR
jgi:hypothetical protein